MRIIDANILIYAYDKASPFHKKARIWLDEVLNSLPRAGLPWQSTLSFARIVSNPRIYENPAPVQEAWKQVLT